MRLYSSRNTGGTSADGAVSIFVSTDFVIANTAVLFVEGTVDPAAGQQRAVMTRVTSAAVDILQL